MQDAKDTFYEVLRDRVAAGNALRTVVLRGVMRPAVVVEENELQESGDLFDCFRLRWTGATVRAGIAGLLCEIRYASRGTGAGLDRGRALSAMDAELSAAVLQAPQRAVKKSFAALADGGDAVELPSRVWWSDVRFDEAKRNGATLERVATVTVWSFEEAGAQ